MSVIWMTKLFHGCAWLGLVEEKKAQALRREQQDKERKDRLELEEAFKKNSKTDIPPHVRNTEITSIVPRPSFPSGEEEMERKAFLSPP